MEKIEINPYAWTKQQHFTNTKQFSTRLTLKQKPIATVKDTTILGTMITDDLKWLKKKSLMKKSKWKNETNEENIRIQCI